MAGKASIGRVAAITAMITAAAIVIAAGIGFATGGIEPGRGGRGSVAIDERKTLSLDGIDLVAVNATSESVRIVAGAGPTAEAWLHGTVGAGSRENAPTLAVERTGSRAEVRVDHRIVVGPVCGRLELEVSVPAGYARGLSVSTSSGAIEVPERDGTTLALSATSGDVRSGAVQATDFTAKSSSGRVRVESARATSVTVSTTSGVLDIGSVQATDFAAHTSSGDIAVDSLDARHSKLGATSGRITVGAVGGDLRAGTSSGKISLGFTGQPSRVEATATSGDVTVQLPAGAQFSLDAGATSGDIRCAFPITIAGDARGGRRTLVGNVGTPAGSVAIHTSSGSIRVEKQ